MLYSSWLPRMVVYSRVDYSRQPTESCQLVKWALRQWSQLVEGWCIYFMKNSDARDSKPRPLDQKACVCRPTHYTPSQRPMHVRNTYTRQYRVTRFMGRFSQLLNPTAVCVHCSFEIVSSFAQARRSWARLLLLESRDNIMSSLLSN